MLENSEQNDRKSRLPSRRHKRPEHSLQLYMTTRTGGLSVLQIPSAWIQMCWHFTTDSSILSWMILLRLLEIIPPLMPSDSYTSLGNLTSRTSEEQRQSLRACTWSWTRSASWTRPRMRPNGTAPTVKTRQFYQFCINIKKFIIL